MLGPLTYGILSFAETALWTPAQPTTGGGASPHSWEVPGVANFQDAAKTTVAAVTDPVGAVTNQGSDVHDIVQATAANRPTLQQVTINDVTSYVWRFDGVNDYLQGAFGGGAISQPYTVFMVAKSNAVSTAVVALDSADGNNDILVYRSSSGLWRIFAGVDVSGGAYDTNWNVWTIKINGASSEFWLNGVSEGAGNAGTRVLDGLTVGALYNGSLPWKGDIGQILIYPGNLSTADKNQVGDYLERVTGIAWTTIV